MSATSPLHLDAAGSPAQHRPETGRQAMLNRPELRKVPAELLTTLGWVSGTLHLPPHQGLIEFLALNPQLLKLTAVRIPGEVDPIPFVALRREAVILVAPALPKEHVQDVSPGPTWAREIACLLPIGSLRGTITVPEGLRLSDHLQQQGQLLLMRHCLLAPYGATLNAPDARSLPAAVVDLRHVAGVAGS